MAETVGVLPRGGNIILYNFETSFLRIHLGVSGSVMLQNPAMYIKYRTGIQNFPEMYPEIISFWDMRTKYSESKPTIALKLFFLGVPLSARVMGHPCS